MGTSELEISEVLRKLIHALIPGKEDNNCSGWECNPGLGVHVPGILTQESIGKADRFYKGEK